MNDFVRNVNPIRYDIEKMLKGKKAMSTQQIANAVGYTNARVRNILKGMEHSKMVTSNYENGEVWWKKYVKPKPIKRETPVLPGTVKGKLSLAYMQIPVRAGSMDAYQIASRGF